MKPVATLSLALRPSRQLLVLQSVAHALAAACILASAIPPWLAVSLLIPVGFSWALVRRRRQPSGLLLRGDGGLGITDAEGSVTDAVLYPHTLVLSFMVVLLFRQNEGVRSLVVLGDSLSDEDFRQLRLWLRWRGETAPVKATP